MTNLFCLPVTRQRERFVIERRGAAYELPRFDVLRPYFSKFYAERPDSRVEIDGVVHRTTVYVPQDIVDTAYAVVGPLGTPERKASLARILEVLRNYWAHARVSLQRSDSLSAVHSTFLGDEFIPPRFVSRDPESDAAGSQLSWRELQQHARLVLLGPPGAGKTTCLRMLTVDAATDRSRTSLRVPLYIPLRTLRKNESILDRSARELSLGPKAEEFQELLRSGRLMLVLDGLDEVEEQFGSAIVGEILGLSRENPDLGLAIGTREGGYQNRFPGFLHVTILPFSFMESEEWVRRRLGRESASATKLVLRVVADMSSQTVTPLMLSLLATVFEGSGFVPSRASDLILRYVEALVEKWDAERAVKRWKHRPFDANITVRVLCRTAFNSTFQAASLFSEHNLSRWESEWADRVDADDFLKYVWKGSCLLEPIGERGTWHFRDQIVREVLCAKHLVERTDNSLLVKLGESTERLLPVWLYACQISQDASPVLEAIMRSEIPLQVRAEFVTKVLVEEIAVRESAQGEAHRFLGVAFADLGKRLILLESDSVFGRRRIVIGSREAPAGDLLDRCAEILRLLLVRATPRKRQDLAGALMGEDNWLVDAIDPWLRGDEASGLAQVVMMGDTVAVETAAP